MCAKKANGRRSTTFSPASVNSLFKDRSQGTDTVSGSSVQDAEFAEKRWVWLRDDKQAFIKGFVVSELSNNMLKVRCADDSDREVKSDDVFKVNPPKFDKSDDMAELTFLNEASVINNLSARYSSDMIYVSIGSFSPPRHAQRY